MERYYGNSLGVVLGPYPETEISSHLRAQKILRTGPQVSVYAINANHIESARDKLKTVLAKEKP